MKSVVAIVLTTMAITSCTSTDSAESATSVSSTTTTTSSTTTTTTTPLVTLPDLPPMETVPAPSLPLDVDAIARGDRAAIRSAQERLLELGFWLAAADGSDDHTTRQAVMAFQKYYGLAADGDLGQNTVDALNTVSERPHGRADHGDLAEIDKEKQVMFIVHDGVAVWTLNVSTGSEVPYQELNQNTGEMLNGDAVTPNGLFKIFNQRSDGWWEGDLGEMYRPKYFDGGVAIHGSRHIPARPASHGCVRISVDAMDWIWNDEVLPFSTAVWVYGQNPSPA
ncbi:MAG: murein L,D-transpeptidase [Ilumatobacter coccineus]|uniref:Murein L,D-transpeptidase n=1 Tax=Ilumatobacter coccineus TaxID=467094 RepID=A0A2G6K9R7_9ACTN|nr:MAG: murein L,D-transpeptidase [Ilumatobacter coccineus]